MVALVSGLGGPAGFGEEQLRSGNSSYQTFDVSAVFEHDFVVDERLVKSGSLAVSVNGYAIFGLSSSPSSSNSIRPFSGNLMTYVDEAAHGTGQVWVDVDPVADKVTVTWDRVEIQQMKGLISFQLELTDLGNAGLGILFRYGDSDLEARTNVYTTIGGLGIQVDTNLDRLANVSEFGTYVGNTGMPGVWEWVTSISPIRGTAGDDTLEGGPARDVMTGLSGNDTLRGGAGNDILSGDQGNDVLLGGQGDDQLSGGRGDDLLKGGSGNDVLTGGQGTDRYFGGAGFDTADFFRETQHVEIDLTRQRDNEGAALGERFTSIEKFLGTRYDDLLTGDSGASEFWGRHGHDRIDPGTGADYVNGGAGNDFVVARSGNILLQGGEGFDTLDLGGFGTGLTIKLAPVSTIHAGTEFLGFERFIGSDGDDYLSAVQSLTSVMLEGGAGQDRLRGSAEGDTLRGGADRDWLFGDAGDDLLIGGAGADVFLYARREQNEQAVGNDTIADFDTATDRLSIRTGDVPGLSGFSGDVRDLYDNHAVVTGAGIKLLFTADNSIDLLGVTDIEAAIAATVLI